MRGRACASEESKLAGLTVDQSRNGERVTVTTNQANQQAFSLVRSNSAYITSEVPVPAVRAVDVKANSGESGAPGAAVALPVELVPGLPWFTVCPFE